MTIIDAHSHLWLKQDTWVDGKRILSLSNGRSIFMDEEVQMMPPFMVEGKNTAEIFLSNMNYAQVGGAVIVQEIIDGNQNDYLIKVQQQYPNRFFCMGMPHITPEGDIPSCKTDTIAIEAMGLKGIAIPGHRLTTSLHTMMDMFIDYLPSPADLKPITAFDEAGNEVAMKGAEGILTLGDLKEVPVTVEAK